MRLSVLALDDPGVTVLGGENPPPTPRELRALRYPDRRVDGDTIPEIVSVIRGRYDLTTDDVEAARRCGKRACGMSMRTVMFALVIAFGLATALRAQSLTGQVQIVAAARGDTLRSLGSRFGVDPATIARDNGRALDVPLRVGETLTIDNRHVVPPFDGVSIVVNVPQRILFAVTETGMNAFPVAVGRADWPTPLGEFSIATKEINPTWDVPESIREEARRAGRTLPLKVPPGPNNPLGDYWLGLSVGSVGIHGTNAPTRCIR